MKRWASDMSIAIGSSLLLLPLIAVWVLYCALRVAGHVESRLRVWGEVASFLVFFAGSLALEVLLARP